MRKGREAIGARGGEQRPNNGLRFRIGQGSHSGRPPIINSGRVKVIDHATKAKLPTMCPDARWVNDGGLMSYSQDPQDQSRRSAIYVDRILKGAKPADLPVEAPRKFDLVINLKTAKQIGVTIQPEILARATRVIR
jgi:putative ABC transport system substrate-binding protein